MVSLSFCYKQNNSWITYKMVFDQILHNLNNIWINKHCTTTFTYLQSFAERFKHLQETGHLINTGWLFLFWETAKYAKKSFDVYLNRIMKTEWIRNCCKSLTWVHHHLKGNVHSCRHNSWETETKTTEGANSLPVTSE